MQIVKYSMLCKWQILKELSLCLNLSGSTKDIPYLVLWILSRIFMKKQNVSENQRYLCCCLWLSKSLVLLWAKKATGKNCLTLRFKYSDIPKNGAEAPTEFHTSQRKQWLSPEFFILIFPFLGVVEWVCYLGRKLLKYNL